MVVRSVARSDTRLLSLVLSLKCFQRVGSVPGQSSGREGDPGRGRVKNNPPELINVAWRCW